MGESQETLGRHFRTGIQTAVRRSSTNPSWEGCAIERYVRNVAANGPKPYTGWKSLTDTATTPYENYVTGNHSLPKTKGEWAFQMGELGNRMHILLLGGVGKLNTRQLCGGPDEEGGERGPVFRVTLKTPPTKTLVEESPRA